MEEPCPGRLTISTDDGEYDGVGRRRHDATPITTNPIPHLLLTWFT